MTDRSAPPAASELGYAAALAELEAILVRLDQPDIDVDLLATEVRRAADLIAVCRERITAARVQVEQIVGGLEGTTSAPTA